MPTLERSLRRLGLDRASTLAAVAARFAFCSCEQLRLRSDGDPVRVSVCHCLACQQRTGSAFGFQARFPVDEVRIEGRFTEYTRISHEGESRTFSFCPDCGSTVFYKTEGADDLVAVPVGAFADPSFPPPRASVYEARMHSWVAMPDGVERGDQAAWSSALPAAPPPGADR